MKTPRRWTRTTLVMAVSLLAIAPLPARAALPPLVKREIFLGNPERSQPRLSPDGTHILYLAPSSTNVLNVWVRTVGRQDDRMVTHDTYRGIRTASWAQNNRHVLYQQDVGGNENFHVFSVDLSSGVEKDLTPHEGVRAQGIQLDKNHPDEMLVGLNLRDRKVFDVHRINIVTGESKLDTENPGDVAEWFADPDFVIRGAVAADEKDGSSTLRARDSVSSRWRDLVTLPFGESGSFEGFAADGKSGYATTSIGSDVKRLVRMNLKTGAELETLASDTLCDVGTVMVQPDTRQVQAVGLNYLRNHWEVLDPSIEADFAALEKVRDGDFSIVSRDRADATWIVAYTVDDGPVAWYTYDRKARKAALLFTSQSALEKATLAKMRTVVVTARDGMKLPGYLTLPPGLPPKRLPMVLVVHGGPWGRDTWGYGPTVQWLANRGYAVLQVNFRASTGFGKKHLNAGNRQWGQTMQNDLTDAVQWAIDQGYADPKRVAIFGGSYGGYATLAGVTFTPDLYACGVDIVGPSNLKTLLSAIPPYWAVGRKEMVLRMGDVETDSLFNRQVSPLFHAEKIHVPLLIGQGQNDPRVNVRESDQIVAELRARHLPVEYVVYKDEGHGFARPLNRIDFFGRAEQFLAKHLGGRAEPYATLEGTTAEVR